MRKIYINEEHDDLFVFAVEAQEGIMFPLSFLHLSDVEDLCNNGLGAYLTSKMDDVDALGETMTIREAIESGAYTEITREVLEATYCVD